MTSFEVAARQIVQSSASRLNGYSDSQSVKSVLELADKEWGLGLECHCDSIKGGEIDLSHAIDYPGFSCSEAVRGGKPVSERLEHRI